MMAAKKSELEARLLWLLRTDAASGVPPPETQFRFHPTRKWQFDFAWPTERVAVEIEGGSFGRPVVCHQCNARVRARKRDGSPGKFMMSAGGSHSREPRFTSDCEKYNAAIELGWVVVRITGPMLHNAPVPTIEQLARIVLARAANRMLGLATKPDTPSERAAAAAWLLQAGVEVKSHELAVRLGMTTRGAYRLLGRLMRVLPIERSGRVWRKIRGGDE